LRQRWARCQQARVTPAHFAAVPVAPVAISAGVAVVSLWLLRAKLVGLAISRILGVEIHVDRLKVARRKETSAVLISLHGVKLQDDMKRNALLVPCANVTVKRQKGNYLVDVEVESPVATVYFDNYTLTKNNWRRILSSSKQKKKPAKQLETEAIDVDPEGSVKVGSLEITSVGITGSTILRAFSAPLENRRLLNDVSLRGITVRPKDFQSIESTVNLVEYLTAKAVIAFNKRHFPAGVRDQLLDYTKRVFNKETKDFFEFGRVRIKQIDTALQQIGGEYGNLMTPQFNVSKSTGRRTAH